MRRALLWLAAAPLLPAGCGSAPKPTQVNLRLQASAQVNPNAAGRPSPLLLRVYELKSATAFNAADFVSLFQRDQAELGAELVAREEHMLAPGDSKAVSKVLAPEVKAIGVLAAYRDVEHARWRAVAAVQPNRTQTLVIEAGALAVSAAIAP